MSPVARGGTFATYQSPHRAVLSDELELAALPTAVGLTRLFVGVYLRKCSLEAVTDIAELVASEIVTNAIKATGLSQQPADYAALHDADVGRVITRLFWLESSLEGSGAQDRDDEAILEIAVVPLSSGKPSLPEAYCTLINPGRPIPHRPWISPGLTSTVLATAPPLAEVAPELAARIDGKIVVGHNVGVDYRLLRRRCPDIKPRALIDTLRLARHLNPARKRNALGELLERHGLTADVTRLVPDSQPHRALWDTVGTALLLPALISDLAPGTTVTLADLITTAGLTVEAASAREHKPPPQQEQGTLFDPA